MRIDYPFDGINLDKALRIARQLGCEIKIRCGSGEKFVVAPDGGKRVTIAGHGRKDAQRRLTRFLRSIWRRLESK